MAQNDDPKIVSSVYLPQSLWKKLDDQAYKEDRSRNKIIQQVLTANISE